MYNESGNVSINAENIFPIIKKWLYSEKDIFVRELVSNSSDAISKIKKLSTIGEAQLTEGTSFKIKVTVDKDNKIIQFIDNGIGMTDEEVKKYINQVAFSGAKDFVEKYKDKSDDAQIIGHFGLGFYSAFMVSERVRIDTLSFLPGAKAVRWESTGGTEFEMGESDRTERGTTITLHLAEDSLEFLDEFKMRETLNKYFEFLPFELYLENLSAKKEDTKSEEDKGVEIEEPKPINDTEPLWLKDPKECTDEEYKEFYKKAFNDFNDPLFWIHLNMDYPFRLKGILYFPKLKNEMQMMEGQIKLYYNQVFVADNIKEVIPEFLMLLKGTIDCPDLPLNVSRSFLQNDGYVSKISSHITKKVADKLTNIFENERESYNKYWDDINPFVKFGCIREDKFFDRVKDIVIYKTINSEHVTLKDYLEKNKEKHENVVYYVSDDKQQAQYIKMFKENGIDAVILTHAIDTHFLQTVEMKESGVNFSRIDSNISETMKEKEEDIDENKLKEMQETLTSMFKEAVGDEKLELKLEGLKSTTIPCVIVLDERARRIKEMSAIYGGMGMDMSHMFGNDKTLVVNKRNPLIQSLLKMKEETDKKDNVKLICQHLYDTALLSNEQLKPETMTNFIERSNAILTKLAEIQTN